IRTGDLGHPKAARYQAAPRPDRPSLERVAGAAMWRSRPVASFQRRMADVRPLNALHYALGKVGSLDAVLAPPYDVIDAAGRARLLERSPYNAVAIALPKPFDPADPASNP